MARKGRPPPVPHPPPTEEHIDMQNLGGHAQNTDEAPVVMPTAEHGQDESRTAAPLVAVGHTEASQEEAFARKYAGHVTSITIHGTDALRPDSFATHPVVLTHVMDLVSGEYVKKSAANRPVTCFSERGNAAVDFVLPVMTKPYEMGRGVVPAAKWEEPLIFNEDYLHMLSPNTMLFFEILDFMPMGRPGTGKPIAVGGVVRGAGWKRIAWGFLKPRGVNGSPNTEKRLRLQLYRYPRKSTARPFAAACESRTPEVFSLYRSRQGSSKKLKPYDGTLYVTVRGVPPIPDQEVVGRPLHPNQIEVGRATFEELVAETKLRLAGREAGDNKLTMKLPVSWRRLPGQICRAPNRGLARLETARKGCFAIRYSNDGRLIAAACADDHDFPIRVFDAATGRPIIALNGHRDLVYDLCWSPNDSHLLSASSDGTARVWDVASLAPAAKATLPHPCYVYSAQFVPAGEGSAAVVAIATGGYDGAVRVWRYGGSGGASALMREMHGHASHVNSLVLDPAGIKMFTGDGAGVIRMWVRGAPSSTGEYGQWDMLKVIEDSEIKGDPISSIRLHPNGRKLLVHARDNAVRIMDLRTFSFTQRFSGAVNAMTCIRSVFSACGNFVLAGSEDGNAYMWDCDTGKTVCVYGASDLHFESPVCDVAFHPHDHMAAFCSFSPNAPVVTMTYDSSLPPRDHVPVSVALESFMPNNNNKNTINASSSLRQSAVNALTSTTSRTGRASQPGPSSASTSGKLPPLPRPSSTSARPGHATAETLSLSESSRDIAMAAEGARARARLMRAERLMAAVAAIGARGDASAFGTDSLNITRNSFSGSELNVTGAVQASAMNRTSTGEKERVRALYDFEPRRTDELAFQQGDVIEVVAKESDNWWLGLVSDRRGYFPVNYVELLPLAEDLDRTLSNLIETGTAPGLEATQPLHPVQPAPAPTPKPAPITPTNWDSLLQSMAPRSLITSVRTKEGDLRIIDQSEAAGSVNSFGCLATADTGIGTPDSKDARQERRRRLVMAARQRRQRHSVDVTEGANAISSGSTSRAESVVSA